MKFRFLVLPDAARFLFAGALRAQQTADEYRLLGIRQFAKRSTEARRLPFRNASNSTPQRRPVTASARRFRRFVSDDFPIGKFLPEYVATAALEKFML